MNNKINHFADVGKMIKAEAEKHLEGGATND